MSTLNYTHSVSAQSTVTNSNGTNQIIQPVKENHYLVSATILLGCLMIASSIVWQRKQKRMLETAGMLVPIPEEHTSTNVDLPIIPAEQDWKTMIMDLHLQGQERTASLVSKWGQEGQDGIWKMASYFEITSPQFKSPAGYSELSTDTKKDILKKVYLELFAHLKEHSNVA